jgi:hypothetical protein
MMIPTVKGFAVRVDEPHPANRLGVKLLYKLRKLLFRDFGLDVAMFRPLDAD